MKEILGGNLMQFMINMTDRKEYERHQRTYDGKQYEVWEVSDELFEDMCNMTEDEFYKLAGWRAWWRYSDGSNLGTPDTTYTIKGNRLRVWERRDRTEWCDGCAVEEDDEETCVECLMYSREFSSLSEYLCNEVGASVEKNVCACAMDLAKYNGMTMGELFSKFEG